MYYYSSCYREWKSIIFNPVTTKLFMLWCRVLYCVLIHFHRVWSVPEQFCWFISLLLVSFQYMCASVNSFDKTYPVITQNIAKSHIPILFKICSSWQTVTYRYRLWKPPGWDMLWPTDMNYYNSNKDYLQKFNFCTSVWGAWFRPLSSFVFNQYP